MRDNKTIIIYTVLLPTAWNIALLILNVALLDFSLQH
jgi:hypothetical protein